MRQVVFLLAIAIFSPMLCFGQQYDSTYGEALILLTESDPWLEVIGSDLPSFVLYEKGQVIYSKPEDKHIKLYEARLDEKELAELINSFDIDNDIYGMQDYIQADEATDQPTTTLQLRFKTFKTINVYGNMAWDGAKKKIPAKFLAVYDKIKAYSNARAREWQPNIIEVMFWDYNYAPNKKPWPKEYPDLQSASTIKRGADSYSVYMDIKYLPEIERFVSTRGEKEAIEINGRLMAIAYRLPLPNIK
jgi:hypothetical protein